MNIYKKLLKNEQNSFLTTKDEIENNSRGTGIITTTPYEKYFVWLIISKTGFYWRIKSEH